MSKGNGCANPLCTAPCPDLEGQSVDIGDEEAYQEIYCHACGASWTDVYKLDRVEGLNLINCEQLFDQEALDEAVHDLLSKQASEINNQGLEAQIQFLKEQGWSDRDIRDLYEEKE